MKIFVIATLVTAAALLSLLIQQKARVESSRRELLFQQQERQLAELLAMQQQLSNSVVRVATPSMENHTAELAKLRSEAEALRKQSNELANKLEWNAETRHPPSAETPETHPPEYPDHFHFAAGAKDYDASKLATAILLYTVQHDGQVPTNLDLVAAELEKITKGIGQTPISGTNQFDIVYEGSTHDLGGIPSGEVAVIRDRDTWAAPDGKLVRVYGMLNGHIQIVTSDDNFQSWEAEHVIGKIGDR